MLEERIEITKSARYYSLGNSLYDTKEVWIVFHGYGQLAKYFIKNFEVISCDDNIIVAPEALSKFYLKGFTGRIGASWMTAEDREEEINDNLKYIDNLYDKLKHESPNARLNILGFSQGTYTALRWLQHAKPNNINNLIMWSAGPPKELKNEMFDKNSYLGGLKKKLVIGEKDELMTEEYITGLKELIKNGQNLEFVEFEGTHKIDEDTLRNIV